MSEHIWINQLKRRENFHENNTVISVVIVVF